MAAEALLNLPAGQVGIDDSHIPGCHQAGSRAHHHIFAAVQELLPQSLYLVPLEVFLQPDIGHIAEEHIVRHETLRQPAYLGLGLHQLPHVDHLASGPAESLQEVLLVAAHIEIHGPDGLILPGVL